MANQQTTEERETLWWLKWWSADYSWEGLAAKPWVGWVVDLADETILEARNSEDRAVRPATLQDYWRDQQSDLVVAPDGVAFTKVHAPLRWKDGTLSEKQTWKRSGLDEIIERRLAGSASTQTDSSGQIKGGIDRRCQLQGAVLLRTAFHAKKPNEELHLNAQQAHFCSGANYTGLVFGPDASFAGACFADEARFHTVHFKGRAIFEKSRCSPQGFIVATPREVSSHRLLVSIVMTLESVFALTLYFLFGLAVRRRFQIG